MQSVYRLCRPRGERQPCRPAADLAALYQRRKAVLSLIRSLERYRQAVGGRIRERSRRTSSAAA